MSITALSGALVVNGGSNNPTAGPSLFVNGPALLDPRTPYTYAPGGSAPVYGFGAFSHIGGINGVPYTLTANNIAASQTPAAGTALTLVSSSAAGITVSTSIVRADTGATVTGLLAIDGAASYTSFGDDALVRLWNPATLIARAVRIVSASNDSAGTFTVRGFDIYNYPITETITGANTATATGAKAFKYILSITPAGTLGGGAVTVGTTDVIGLPLRADYVSETEINMADTWITASTGFTAAVTTTPSATTGDVRGTYTLQTASNNARRLAIYQTPLIANLTSSTGLFGATQYADF